MDFLAWDACFFGGMSKATYASYLSTFCIFHARRLARVAARGSQASCMSLEAFGTGLVQRRRRSFWQSFGDMPTHPFHRRTSQSVWTLCCG